MPAGPPPAMQHRVCMAHRSARVGRWDHETGSLRPRLPGAAIAADPREGLTGRALAGGDIGPAALKGRLPPQAVIGRAGSKWGCGTAKACRGGGGPPPTRGRPRRRSAGRRAPQKGSSGSWSRVAAGRKRLPRAGGRRTKETNSTKEAAEDWAAVTRAEEGARSQPARRAGVRPECPLSSYPSRPRTALTLLITSFLRRVRLFRSVRPS